MSIIAMVVGLDLMDLLEVLQLSLPCMYVRFIGTALHDSCG